MTVLVKRFSSNALSEHWNELVSRGRIESIFNRLSKWVVSALFASIILLRHDGTALWAIIGSVSNSALSVFLKRLLNQARPATTSRTDPGMPSSHAQSISFISVFAVFYGMAWNQRSLSVPNHAHPRIGFIFYTVKVSQKLHTGNQVVVGGLVGSVFCIFWYKTWNLLLLEAFKSSLLLQIYVFLVASAYTLAFAAYVVLNSFRHDR
ncbi:hypothetical protein Bca4012_094892 [Brassica carinata]|uniref:Phosphatidic acid phosphatase type 2/haloperoxidase domain-containing protein n=1 Tax=Brassica carinata TaxID=52824 RepID=A0A8X7PU57_BRACI|nr:hypothetical protein Bca52824_077029 [Brassica carinata]